ncbi:hypothetical protein [Peribacillus simplex]|uniref:hypothetical protein n=1 Tax=Peribacillus simplex TaxID=1478 RepID=UPI000B3357AB
MSKRKRTSTIKKWIKEGCGTVIGADYQRWLKIKDVSSLGVGNLRNILLFNKEKEKS